MTPRENPWLCGCTERKPPGFRKMLHFCKLPNRRSRFCDLRVLSDTPGLWFPLPRENTGLLPGYRNRYLLRIPVCPASKSHRNRPVPQVIAAEAEFPAAYPDFFPGSAAAARSAESVSDFPMHISFASLLEKSMHLSRGIAQKIRCEKRTGFHYPFFRWITRRLPAMLNSRLMISSGTKLHRTNPVRT